MKYCASARHIRGRRIKSRNSCACLAWPRIMCFCLRAPTPDRFHSHFAQWRGSTAGVRWKMACPLPQRETESLAAAFKPQPFCQSIRELAREPCAQRPGSMPEVLHPECRSLGVAEVSHAKQPMHISRVMFVTCSGDTL